MRRVRTAVGFIALLLTLRFLAGCGATAVQVLPTDIPTPTSTFTPAPSRTPGRDTTPTRPPPTATLFGGASPTPLFGPTATGDVALPTPTRPPNPNAPRIEFFTSDVLALAPGETVTLFWSARGSATATIYRVEPDGVRSQLWNVPADGSLAVPTRRRDRVQVEFVLSVGDGADRTEMPLVLPLSCPDAWFFQPAPESCPDTPPEETFITEQQFERGRMVYVLSTDILYGLFNDGFPPAWISFDNRYDPAIHPESEESFVPPPDFVQPVRAIGFVWRGNDLVRSRLGLGLQPESSFEGFVQTATNPDGTQTIYLSSSDGSVLQLVAQGDAWQIIIPPSPN